MIRFDLMSILGPRTCKRFDPPAWALTASAETEILYSGPNRYLVIDVQIR